MLTSIKARTPVLVFILAALGVSYTFAQNKVVVVPLGDSGISGYEIVNFTTTTNAFQTGTFAITATCPEGKKVLGGGGSEEGPSFVINKSYPVSETQWQVGWNEIVPDDNSFYQITVYAICAIVS